MATGTVLAFTPQSDHEALVYKRLHTLQGNLIPVYLGSVDLSWPYFLDVGVKIARMLFMSWAGESMPVDPGLGREYYVHPAATSAEKILLTLGVERNDVRPANVLIDPRNQSIMLADFERSKILEKSSALRPSSPNLKRKHRVISDAKFFEKDFQNTPTVALARQESFHTTTQSEDYFDMYIPY